MMDLFSGKCFCLNFAVRFRNTYEPRNGILSLLEVSEVADSAEVVIGEIPVVMRLSVGSERLSLFLTSSRIIVARVGKRAVGSEASFPLFALLSGPIEGLFKWRRESSKKKTAASLLPEGILAADRENFPIPYEQIVSVEVEQTTFTTRIMLLTTQDKMLFTTSLGFDKVLHLFREQVGDSKLTVKRTS